MSDVDRLTPEGELEKCESECLLPQIDWATLEASFSQKSPRQETDDGFKEEVTATVEDLRLKLAQLSSNSSDGSYHNRSRARTRSKKQMKIYFVNDLSSDSEPECESELNSEARRLESQAKQAMVDAQRQAEISLQLVKRDGLTPVGALRSPSDLANEPMSGLINYKTELVNKIAKLNDELLNCLVTRDELKTKQDAILADCEDLQVLLTTLVRETTV